MTNGFATCILVFLLIRLHRYRYKYKICTKIYYCILFSFSVLFVCVSVCLCVRDTFARALPSRLTTIFTPGYDPLVKLGACLFRFVVEKIRKQLKTEPCVFVFV